MFARIYTDGASSPHRGNADAGAAAVLLIWASPGEPLLQSVPTIRTIAKHLVDSTNNVAELTGIKLGLDAAYTLNVQHVRVLTDSRYCVGMLTSRPFDGFWNYFGWAYEAGNNLELISYLRHKLLAFSSFSIEWVPGHADDEYNNLADRLSVWCKNNRMDHPDNSLAPMHVGIIKQEGAP
jgi:ribonuclease HI